MKGTLSIFVRVLALFVIYTMLLTVGSSPTTPGELADMLSPEPASAFSAVLPLVSACHRR